MGWRVRAFPSKQRPRRWLWTVQEVPSFSPLPHPQWPGAALPAWIALPGILGPLSPWASCSWCCCVRALSLQSSGAGAELNLVIPLLRGSQDLKGSACSRSLLMDKRMCSRDGKTPLPGCGKVSHLFIWRQLIVPLLLQIWQELWCS